jgi:hypothetical protein
MNELNKNNPGPDYAHLLAAVKERVRSAQYTALKAVNTELVGLYWDIGRMIVERQRDAEHGTAIAEQLSNDLRTEFPGISGFPGAMSSTCGSFTFFTATTSECNHWLHKSAGFIIW